MMSYKDFKTLFLQIFLKNGIDRDVSEEMIEKFFQLTEIMVRTNQVMNITALTTEEKRGIMKTSFFSNRPLFCNL